MELKLKKAGHDYYEGVAWPPFSCETMRESIVPDSCADIARIVDTTGLVCLTGRELTGDGRFCASGTVEVSVLYIPEKGDGPARCVFRFPSSAAARGKMLQTRSFWISAGNCRASIPGCLTPGRFLHEPISCFIPLAAAMYHCLYAQMPERMTALSSFCGKKRKHGL